MPLLTGNWRFFVGGPDVGLAITDLQPSGNFAVSAGLGLYAQLFPPVAMPPNMTGFGLWNEIGQAISFTLQCNTPEVGRQALVFTGCQVHPAGGADPAQDLVWTLVGEFRHALFPGQAMVLLPDESARRSVFGWYAQIIQVM
jgi:hypothetical protein